MNDKTVWVVTTWEDGEEPIISVFDNEDTARRYRDYCERSGKNNCIDEAPVFKHFEEYD